MNYSLTGMELMRPEDIRNKEDYKLILIINTDNIDPELLEQIKVGALVVCALSLWMIAYQMYANFGELIDVLAALVNKGN
ncbi:hypothetical protein ACFX4I_25615 [Peribacillus sp. YIM B13472]|uniref:hypothetical protein n=1 Tax=Peribacillus sp. YIM B13472 TaxID=3366297 RepID=UPI0036702D8C